MWLEIFVEIELYEAVLVVNGNGCCAAGDCLLDVIDGDDVAEDGAGAGVGLLDGGAGEADEGCTGQGVANVAGEAVDEIVLAAVGFVGNDDDVAAGGAPSSCRFRPARTSGWW